MSDQIHRNEINGYEMAPIPAGKAIFGSADDDPDAWDREKPQFEAELKGFYLGLYSRIARMNRKGLGADTNKQAS